MTSIEEMVQSAILKNDNTESNESEVINSIHKIIDDIYKTKDTVTYIPVLKEQLVFLSKFNTKDSKDLLDKISPMVKDELYLQPATKTNTNIKPDILKQITTETKFCCHHTLLEEIKKHTITPIVNGLETISNFMLIYGVSGSGHDDLAIHSAQLLRKRLTSDLVYAVELNCFDENGCKNRIWNTFSTSQSLAKDMMSSVSSEAKKNCVRTVILLKDIDLISDGMQEELLAVSKSTYFPNVLLIATSSNPGKILPALRQRFFPRIFVNLMSKETICRLFVKTITDLLKPERITTNDEVLTVGTSNGTTFNRQLNDYLMYIAEKFLIPKGEQRADGKGKSDALQKMATRIYELMFKKFSADALSAVTYTGKQDETISKIAAAIGPSTSFSPTGRFRYGYSYQDVINLAKSIYIRLTDEVNSLSGDTGNCVYNIKNRSTPVDNSKDKPSKEEYLSEMTGQLNTLTQKLTELKEEAAKEEAQAKLLAAAKATAAAAAAVDAVEGKSEAVQEKKEEKDEKEKNELAKFYNSKNHEVRAVDILGEGHDNRLKKQCDKKAPKLDLTRLHDFNQLKAIKHWVTDEVKYSKSTIDEMEYVKMIKFEISTDPEPKDTTETVAS